jgi:DNA polymerase-3 subunit delta'
MAKRPTKSPATRATTKAAPRAAGLRSETPPPPPLAPIPIPFSEILGQDRALSVLQTSIKSGRVHHAWIFQGPPGVGKFTTALAFAAIILDPTAQPNFGGQIEPDPDSTVQRLIRSGTHPDLHIITKELARYDEDAQIRERKLTTIPRQVLDKHLILPATLAPSVRNDAPVGKVFIVDEAELITPAVQNVLLKTMEEPPEKTVIILITSSEDRLLPTIRSRCQRVAFNELPNSAMTTWLASFTKTSETPIASEQRDWLLRFSQGSPGVFQMALAGGLFAWQEKLSPMIAKVLKGEHVIEMAGAMHSLVDGWAKAWVEDHQNASKEAANKAGADWMFRYLGEELRGVLRTSARTDANRAEMAAAALDRLRLAESQIDSNVNPTLVFDSLTADTAAIFAGESVTV